jgi:hypothetical protein
MRVIWNVRPSPAANTWSGLALVMSFPRNLTWPSSAVSYPLITLNRVVLPDPFGPIRPLMAPSSKVIVHPVSARMPP